MRRKLSPKEIPDEMVSLPHWQLAEDGSSILRKFTFGDFNAAFGFMTRVAMLAEKMDHHPDWRNVYRQVDVTLSTHDVGGLTELDMKMARKMDQFAAQLAA